MGIINWFLSWYFNREINERLSNDKGIKSALKEADAELNELRDLVEKMRKNGKTIPPEVEKYFPEK